MWYFLAVTIGAILGWAGCSCCVSVKLSDAARQKIVYDFETNLDKQQMKSLLARINNYGFRLIAVSQDGDLYTVCFARFLNG